MARSIVRHGVDVASRWHRLLRNHPPIESLDATDRSTTVAVARVSIVADLARLDDAVAAHRDHAASVHARASTVCDRTRITVGNLEARSDLRGRQTATTNRARVRSWTRRAVAARNQLRLDTRDC